MVHMFNINEIKENECVEKLNMKDEIKIEYYFGRNKINGYNIIKNNDMLQYHYFSQEYNVIKTASILCLLYIEHSNIKNYVGFLSISSPTLNKTFRNAYFGTNFLKKMYAQKSKRNDLKLYSISRMVFIPSFRGIGVTKHVQDEIANYLFTNPDNFKELDKIIYLEIFSNMLHTFDFSGNTFNKFFVNAKKNYGEQTVNKYFEPKITVDNYESQKNHVRGFKGLSKLVANYAFIMNENYHESFQQYFKTNYTVENIGKEIYEPLDHNKCSPELLFDFKENRIPLILLQSMSEEEIRGLKYES